MASAIGLTRSTDILELIHGHSSRHFSLSTGSSLSRGYSLAADSSRTWKQSANSALLSIVARSEEKFLSLWKTERHFLKTNTMADSKHNWWHFRCHIFRARPRNQDITNTPLQPPPPPLLSRPRSTSYTVR